MDPYGTKRKRNKRNTRLFELRKNPPTRDPRTQKQIDAYRKKERARANWLRDYRQWEHYKIALGDKAPKTFETFQKHKKSADETYKKWQKLYKER